MVSFPTSADETSSVTQLFKDRDSTRVVTRGKREEGFNIGGLHSNRFKDPISDSKGIQNRGFC
jgi:hypothetical protein